MMLSTTLELTFNEEIIMYTCNESYHDGAGIDLLTDAPPLFSHVRNSILRRDTLILRLSWARMTSPIPVSDASMVKLLRC